jgi:hypothetical protein
MTDTHGLAQVQGTMLRNTHKQQQQQHTHTYMCHHSPELLLDFTTRKPANSIPRSVSLHHLVQTCFPHPTGTDIQPTLHNRKHVLVVGACMCGQTAVQPAHGARRGFDEAVVVGAHTAHHVVELHADVGANLVLAFDLCSSTINNTSTINRKHTHTHAHTRIHSTIAQNTTFKYTHNGHNITEITSTYLHFALALAASRYHRWETGTSHLLL